MDEWEPSSYTNFYPDWVNRVYKSVLSDPEEEISYRYDKSGILKMLYSLLADQGELDYEANLAIAVLNGDRVAARALADKIVEEIGGFEGFRTSNQEGGNHASQS